MIIKRLNGIIILLTIVAVAIILVALYMSYMSILSQPECGTPMIRAKIATSPDIALRDGYVQQYLGLVDNYSIESLRMPSSDYYSYSNSTVRAVVPIRIRSQYIDEVLEVTVDPFENRTVSILHNYSGGPMNDTGRMAMIKAALKDPGIQDAINNSDYSVTINNTTTHYRGVYIITNAGLHVNGGDYGLLNDTSAYYDVSVQAGEMPPIYRTTTATLDMASGRVVLTRAQDAESLHPAYYTAVVRPGASFYRSYGGGWWNHTIANYPVNDSTGGLSLVKETSNASRLVPIFVDPENLEKLRNGSSYTALNVTLDYSDRGWRASVPGNTSFYLVLKNNDPVHDAVISVEPRSLWV